MTPLERIREKHRKGVTGVCYPWEVGGETINVYIYPQTPDEVGLLETIDNQYPGSNMHALFGFVKTRARNADGGRIFTGPLEEMMDGSISAEEIVGLINMIKRDPVSGLLEEPDKAGNS